MTRRRHPERPDSGLDGGIHVGGQGLLGLVHNGIEGIDVIDDQVGQGAAVQLDAGQAR